MVLYYACLVDIAGVYKLAFVAEVGLCAAFGSDKVASSHIKIVKVVMKKAYRYFYRFIPPQRLS